ncbi:hypothetical protein ANANG_G00056870 [Anguilla anguilla]|uniref:Kinase n=1 Tax=Anguilla anguilla TaxID=7936 RepID=A0A9D3MN39_ANGAN|nr:hypothetical protein ANANG_G00056870 [Anguilla anguilla]
MEHVASRLSLKEGTGEGMRKIQIKERNAEDIGEEKKGGDDTVFTSENCRSNWRFPASDGTVTVHKVKPKLCSAKAMCFSSQEPAHSLTEPEETKNTPTTPWQAAESEPGSCEHLDQNQAAHVTGETAEDEKTNRKGEEDRVEERLEVDDKLGEDNWGGGPRRKILNMNDKAKAELKVRRARLGGEGEVTDWERRKRWARTGRGRDGAELKEESETEIDPGLDGARASGVERGPECFSEGETEKSSISHTLLSRMLLHSSASSSSSSSSFTYSSPESDEVFSENEATTTRRQRMRKCRSWKTFTTMMQWSVRRHSSWVQLAGHQGNFQPSEGGEVLKRYNAVESSCLQALMNDSLRQFVPCYRGLTTRGSESYIRLEDLLSGLSCPVIMDCKMGVRTYLEEELVRARSNPCLRTDMYQKMVKIDPAAPSAEEHAQGGVTKPRYMQWRDSVSSTSTLGFRIEGITAEDGRVLRDFKKTRTSAQVTNALLSFTKRQSHILEAYLSRLQALSGALKESEFFKTHEVIGSSLLFVHDRTNKANVWMIDFGKTTPTPSSVHLKHNIPWVEGNREDGYIIGLSTLTLLVKEALRQAVGQHHDEGNIPVHVDHQTGTQHRSQPCEITHNHI